MDSPFAHSSVNRGGPPCSARGEKDRKTLPFVGSPFSQWDARNDGDRTGQPSSRGGPTLAAREREVLAMIGHGFSNKRIARALQISPETVKSHVKHIFLKLAVSTRTEAVFRAFSLGPL
jgi:DNA-binding CsgD family transcriptional regulator